MTMQSVVLIFTLFVGAYASRMNTYEDMLDSLNEVDNFEEVVTNDDEESSSNSNVENDVSFWLYNRESENRPSGHQLIPGQPDMLRSSSFRYNASVKIIIHGWLGDSENAASLCVILKQKYFEQDDINVVCVDWRKISLDLNYVGARVRCRAIGEYVAELVTMIADEMEQPLENIHLMGFSMGAHIAGFAGKKLNAKIGRITGMDPARPLFPIVFPDHRLSRDDAQLVDVIHSSNLLLGQMEPLGTVDFYPNGGHTRQPGCAFYDYFDGGICSHQKSYEFYARSIQAKDNFKAVRCDSWTKYMSDECNDNDSAYMGEYTDVNVAGNYFLKVDEQLMDIF